MYVDMTITDGFHRSRWVLIISQEFILLPFLDPIVTLFRTTTNTQTCLTMWAPKSSKLQVDLHVISLLHAGTDKWCSFLSLQNIWSHSSLFIQNSEKEENRKFLGHSWMEWICFARELNILGTLTWTTIQQQHLKYTRVVYTGKREWVPCLWCLSRSLSTRDQNTGKHCWTLIIISHRFSLAFYLRCMPGYANLVQLGRRNGAVCVKYLLQFQAPPSTQEILAADLISVSNSPTLNFFTMLPGLCSLCSFFALSSLHNSIQPVLSIVINGFKI